MSYVLYGRFTNQPDNDLVIIEEIADVVHQAWMERQTIPEKNKKQTKGLDHIAN